MSGSNKWILARWYLRDMRRGNPITMPAVDPHFNLMLRDSLLEHERLHNCRIEGHWIHCKLEMRSGVLVPIRVRILMSILGLNGKGFYAPEVYCDECWMTRNIDWHVYNHGELCWVFNREWTYVLNRRYSSGIKLDDLADLGAQWLVRNVENLINKHNVGFCESLTEWLPEWGGYEHGIEKAEDQLIKGIQLGLIR
ncbi:hypothetical protein NT6N_00350 [Oceaniferula spumae]|uniref:DUF402 domain-containing protein n=1 Tax=Oceaniferula spumae TaxID=2979115 RepID=A0AAT9FG85_9BACT